MLYLSFFRSSHHIHLIKDLLIIIASIIFAVILAKSGFIYWLVALSQEMRIVATFVAGAFFTSMVTIAPAGVALAEIAKSSSIFWTSFFGAFGAVVGDLIIFKFVKDAVSEDFIFLLGLIPESRFKSIFHHRMFRWLWPFLGALVIASPLPDELGITMLGLAKMKTRYFVFVSYAFNFLGIFLLGLLVRA